MRFIFGGNWHLDDPDGILLATKNVDATKNVWWFQNNCSPSNCDTLSRRLHPVKVLRIVKLTATHSFILRDTPARTENAVMFANRLELWRWLLPAERALAWRRSLAAHGVHPPRVYSIMLITSRFDANGSFIDNEL